MEAQRKEKEWAAAHFWFSVVTGISGTRLRQGSPGHNKVALTVVPVRTATETLGTHGGLA